MAQQSNTYFIESSSGAETARLILQDKLVTQGLGGLLPASVDLSTTRNVLDLACGPAGWALNVAFQYPATVVVGVDVNAMMIDYARAEADVQRLPNAHFQEMDLLKPLDFADGSFDLVHGRFLAGFMPREAWPVLVQECWRVLRPGGMLCLIEGDAWSISGSPAVLKLGGLAIRAMFKAGLSFATEGNSFGLSPLLPRFLGRAGFQDVQISPHMLDFSIGTEAHEAYYQNFTVANELLQPFIIRMGVAMQEELTRLQERMRVEMISDDFYALWYFVAASGRKPGGPESK
jgi:SAM-dependent methyltransferase